MSQAESVAELSVASPVSLDNYFSRENFVTKNVFFIFFEKNDNLELHLEVYLTIQRNRQLKSL